MCLGVALPDPGDEAAGAQNRAVLIPTARAHAQMKNICTDQPSLERESPEVFIHKLFFHTLQGSEDLLDSGEAWTDISKPHIMCRHFELKLRPETWKAIPGLCGCSPALCLAQRHGVRNTTSHPTAPSFSSMWQLPPSQLNISQPLQCPAGFHHPKSPQAYSPCPSLPYILNCSSRQGVPSNNTMPPSREEEYLGIRV